jgi:hypothetical protein
MEDDVAHVWWYDRQGAIQSHGINFVQDLPYFLVVLLALQRFTEENWGIVSAFRPRNNGQYRFSFPGPLAVDISTGMMLHDHFGIVGRATRVVCASSQSCNPQDSSKELGGVKLVLKISWPEASRVPEAQVIEKAVGIGEHNSNVKGHLPDMICSHDLVGYSTASIRQVLGIETGGHRVLRLILFRQMYPITDLIGEKFWKVFWECFRCE